MKHLRDNCVFDIDFDLNNDLYGIYIKGKQARRLFTKLVEAEDFETTATKYLRIDEANLSRKFEVLIFLSMITQDC